MRDIEGVKLEFIFIELYNLQKFYWVRWVNQLDFLTILDPFVYSPLY